MDSQPPRVRTRLVLVGLVGSGRMLVAISLGLESSKDSDVVAENSGKKFLLVTAPGQLALLADVEVP